MIELTTQVNDRRESERTQRLIAFSDGVFAVAITLLILSIQPPQLKDVPGAKLFAQLLQQWPSWLSYIISFWIVGINWINHHELFRLIKHVDVTLLTLNLLILLFTTILPVPTRLLAEYVLDPDGQRVADIFYGCTLVAVCIVYLVVWLHAARASLLVEGLSPQAIRRGILRRLIGILAGGAGVVIAFFNVPISIVIYVLVVLYYLVTSQSRRYV